MSERNEGSATPVSDEAKQALAELQNEGHVVGEHESVAGDGEVSESEPHKPEKKEEVKPKEDPKSKEDEEKPEDKSGRTPSVVPAWKLKVAEDQHNRKVAELEDKIKELSEQKAPITKTQKDEIADEIKALAEESGADPEFLTKFADAILKKAKPSEIEKTVQDLARESAEEKELEKQEAEYENEFDKDVAPIVKEKYQLSEPALSALKEKLKELAFTETYANVPLAKILKAEEDSLGIQAPKRSSEGNGVKVRGNNVVDLDNVDEDSFKNLGDDAVEKLAESKGSGGWTRR
jgi:hypothetical protein